MNTHMTVKSGTLYLYGGILEQGERSYVLNDLWSLDVKKMNQWRRINKTDKVDWEGSDKVDFLIIVEEFTQQKQGSDTEEDSEGEDNESESEEEDSEPEVKAKRQRPNHPMPFHAETPDEYMKRSRNYWRTVLLEMDDDEEEEELTEEELTIQSEVLAKNWYQKCEKARQGETE